MEDVLELYAEPFDPRYPVVCLDEYPLALVADRRPGQPAAPGRARREDYEYVRCGGCTLFMAFQPLKAWRTVVVRARRTAQDFAWFLRWLVEQHYPEAERIRLVLDNLNIHQPGALYATFPAAEARRIARKLELHYTPVHGSWLNMIEIEWSVLAQQCLTGRRLSTIAVVQREVDAWAAARTAAGASVEWRFTPAAARQRMAGLYPIAP